MISQIENVKAAPNIATRFAENDMEYRVKKSLRMNGVVIKKSRFYWKAKRLFDIVSSLTALILLSPVFLATSLAVVINDPKGGPIFKQVRVGRDGREFTIYKFRSMCVDAEARLEQVAREMGISVEECIVLPDDPRITKVGKFIRKTSIDELPQLVNILKGDMSVVGPRPPLPSEVGNYADRQLIRLAVKPGLTCIWQVAEDKDSIPLEGRVELDKEYIRKCNMRLDIKLVFRTVGCVFKSKNG